MHSETNLSLLHALRLSSSLTIAIVGAGGKTTVLYQLGRDYQKTHSIVLCTTTTHLGQEQPNAADLHLIHLGNLSDTLERIRSHQGLICLTREWDEQTQRWRGLDLDSLQFLARYAQENAIPLIIEADGARGRSLKAPAEHEPVIPPHCDVVILVAGLAAIGKPLTEEWVHRPERFSVLSGLSVREIIDGEAVQRVLIHPLGGRKGIPAAAKSKVLLTQAETLEAKAAAKKLSLPLLNHFDSVAIAAKGKPLHFPAKTPNETPYTEANFRHPFHLLAVHEPIAGVILAAGASARFGQPKPLLFWRGETLVHRAARLALEAELRPVLVVCGAEGERVAAAVADLPVHLIHSQQWQNGQSTSIRAAVHALEDRCGGAIFILVDQPFISVPLLVSLVESHVQSQAPVIAPLAGDRRANPVLFDRQTFPDLLRLEGDVGGRAIFGRYSPQWLPWYEENLSFDIDTPEDYRRLLEMDARNE